MGDAPDKIEPNEPKSGMIADFDYIKSNFFRVIHVDGVLGGFNSRGLLNIDLWSERPPIPTHAEYKIIDGKTFGEEIVERRLGRKSMIREVEAAVVMDLQLAKAFHGWLTAKIEELEKIFADSNRGSND